LIVHAAWPCFQLPEGVLLVVEMLLECRVVVSDEATRCRANAVNWRVVIAVLAQVYKVMTRR
jgi:hypothetical protein